MKTSATIVGCALSLAATAGAFSTMNVLGTHRSTMTMKRAGPGGKKNINQALGNKPSGLGSGSAAPMPANNWIQTSITSTDFAKLPEGKIELLDTNVLTLKDSLTNPTGAVSVLKQNGETFCFSSSCPSCKIPLSKAKILEPTSSRSSTVVACTFCKSAYDLKSGKKTEVSPDEAGGGIFAGLAQGLFKMQGKNDPLPMYQLGEKDGKLLISIN